MPGSAGQCSNIWGWMTAARATPTCQTHQAELEQQPSRQRPVCTPAGSATPAPPAPSVPPAGQDESLVSCRPAARLALQAACGPTDQLAFSLRSGRGSTLTALHLNSSNINRCSVVESLSTIPPPTLCRIHMQRCLLTDAGSSCAVQSHPQAVQNWCGHAGGLLMRHCASQADQHWLVQVGDWTSQWNVARQLQVAGSDLKGL